MSDHLESKHILIVDDSLDMQILLRTLLQSKGYRIECSSNGEEALALLNSSKELPDVILLDMRMPVFNGSDFLKVQQANPTLRDIPTIIMSGDEDIGLSESTSITNDILHKPINMATVLAAIVRNTQLH